MGKPVKLIAFLLAVCMIASVSGCAFGKKAGAASSAAKGKSASSHAVSTPSKAPVKSSFSLPVTLSHSLNPLTTDSFTNVVLWPLIYDCLAEPDKSYNPVNMLASSIDNSGTTVTVHLRTGVHFSDGSSLTSKDVCYSFNMVLGTPSSFFYQNVTNIQNVSPQGSGTVVFTLKSPDPLFANLLDIPVIKTGSEVSKLTPGTPFTPLGSGKYVFSTDCMNGTLTANKSWYKGTPLSFQTIRLENIVNTGTVVSSLRIGSIDYLFSDYGNGAIPTVGLGTASVNLNRMVYIGVHTATPGLDDAHVRKALSLAVDRQSIVTDVYSSRAAATNLPFNPAWSGIAKPSDIAANYSAASNELSGDGYVSSANGLSKTVNGSQIKLSFRLLVDQGSTASAAAAKKLITSFGKIGVTITLDQQPQDVFKSKVAQGDYDLYIGEALLTDDMDLSAFVASGMITQGGATGSALGAWRSGAAKAQTVADAFTGEFPFIPVCFRTGSVSFTDGLTGNIAPTYFDIFGGVESWHF